MAEFEAAVSAEAVPALPVINIVRQHLAFGGMWRTLQELDKQVCAGDDDDDAAAAAAAAAAANISPGLRTIHPRLYH